MNRKIKKQITTVVILLFFVAAGLWYFTQTGGRKGKQQGSTELTGVLQAVVTEPPVISQEQGNSGDNPTKSPELVVYVCGAVKEPGIYTLADGSRLYEAVTMAGGFSAEADPAYHNLARNIADGERIYILSCAETAELTIEQQAGGEEGAGSMAADAPINLNTATAEQLTTLPGIGEARAADILEYRARIGQFAAIEELMNVSGIGEAMFEKIKDKIIVK